VEQERTDEIGVLMAGFNEMLSEIDLRDEQLRKHREQLEEQVAGDRRTGVGEEYGGVGESGEIAVFGEHEP